MKYFSIWQPLHNEDAHTALVFGFMRHAPSALALDPWLSETLGRDVTADSLEPEAFWPSFPSTVDGHQRTEPELVFPASDADGRVLVVVEVKPGFGQHTDAQIAREVIDAASHRRFSRVELIMVGADRLEPPDVAVWRERLVATLSARGMEDIDVRLRYSPWARIGSAIAGCGASNPEWSRYSDDVTHQLRNLGLLGYDGGPMFDDLDGRLNVPNAMEVVNRALKGAKNLLLSLHADPRFLSLAVQPWDSKEPKFKMDGGIGAGGLQRADWEYETSMIMSAYSAPNWPAGTGIYVAIWLTPDDGEHPELHAGACVGPGYSLSDLVWAYGSNVDEPEDKLARHDALDSLDTTLLDHVWSDVKTEWVFARRDWLPGRGDDDLRWLLENLEAASVAWRGLA